VLVELVINGYVLIINRKSIPTIWLRVAPVLIGLVAGVATGIAYYVIGLYSYENMAIIPYIIPKVLPGIPLGSYLIRLMDPESFRRICMTFDTLIVTL
jgi:uncharacterized membrane protein YfcA